VSKAKFRTTVDDEDTYLAGMIRHYGQFIQYVFGDDDGPSFAYTIGLFDHNHPELLILGLPEETAARVLNMLGDLVRDGRVRTGRTLTPGQVITFDEWPHRIIPEPVPNPGDIVFAANRYYHRPNLYSVPVLQLSYDDRDGRFPWESGYHTPELQPRPGTFRA
jgi:Domain of unknown function (DUF4262)